MYGENCLRCSRRDYRNIGSIHWMFYQDIYVECESKQTLQLTDKRQLPPGLCCCQRIVLILHSVEFVVMCLALVCVYVCLCHHYQQHGYRLPL